MNSENLILRETNYAPLVNKDDFLDNTDFDSNMINIYDDFVSLCITNGVIAYDISTEYDDAVINYATYDGKLWKFVNAVPASNVTPGTNELYWLEVFPTELAHRKNSDTILDEGGVNEVSASEIRAFIDAGLTSTTNLSLSEQTDVSLKINSSTGSDITLLGATETTAGLLNSEDKQKLNQISGINTGDQTLGSLGAEATANKVTDFSVIDNITFPTTEAVANKITSDVVDLVDAELTNYATTVQLATKEDSITAGTTGQYWRGDKTWQTLDKTAVGLGNVANVDTTNASNISSGTLGTARMGSGTADNTTYLRGDGTWATVSAGGLTKFTEAESTTSPNNTVYVDSITAIGASTNVDVAIVPKGSGAFILAIPDGTTTGGNKRGLGAIDLQISRTNANQVASGNYSVALGRTNRVVLDDGYAIGRENTVTSYYGGALGYQNSTSGLYAICLGYQNIASGQSANSFGYANNSSGTGASGIGWGNTVSGNYAVGMGQSCTASASNSISIGHSNNSTGSRAVSLGSSNTSGGFSGICIGYGNTTTYDYQIGIGNTNTFTGTNSNSLAFGSNNTLNASNSMAYGHYGLINSIIGRQVYSSNRFTSNGDSQKSIFFLSVRTTDTTTKYLTTDQTGSRNVTNIINLSNNSLYRYKGQIIAKQSGSTNVASWDIDGLIVRGTSASDTTLLINNLTLIQNTPGWTTPTISAFIDLGNGIGALSIQVNGASATNIQWNCIIETTELIYA